MTTMRRAVAVRAGLMLGLVAVLMGLVAFGVPGYKPWPFLLGFFGAIGVVGLIISTLTDRKLLIQVGRPTPPWSGNYAAAFPVRAAVTPDRALVVARQAIGHLHAHDVQTFDHHTVVGWVGSIWTNLPRWQAYQLAVVVIGQSYGTTELVCCARPRFSLAYFGGSMSRELASDLQQAVSSLI